MPRRILRKPFVRSGAFLVTSIAAMVPKAHLKAEEKRLNGKLKESVLGTMDLGRGLTTGTADPPKPSEGVYPWKQGIVTTTFWIGEKPTKNNPTPNHASSWDPKWAENYGGTDTPVRAERVNFVPKDFAPRQNPFYIALPYNDVSMGQHKPEAAAMIPWFKQAYQGPGKSVLKGRWVAIRRGDKVAYAQWEDCGPFRTDHAAYVFGNERPKPNLNKGAGLDVSPAVRDYLGMADTDVTDWKFVEYKDVPNGPWTTHGDNNPFVLQKRIDTLRVAEGIRTPGLEKTAAR
jgi:hypothetical protein